MKGLLAISAAPSGRCSLPIGLADLAARYLPDPTTIGAQRVDDGWVAWSGADPGDRVPAGGPADELSVRLTRSMRGRDGDLRTDRLAGLLGDGTALDAAALCHLLPPFGGAHRAGTGAPLVIASDWLGYRHLYWWQGDGVAAVSTSALALAAITGADLNAAALGVQSLLGWQVGVNTLFRGVTKLAPGCAAVLRDGRVEVRRYAESSLPTEGPPADLAGVVDEMAGILRDLLGSCLDDHPDTVLQLSGGQDSRLLLCAVPPHMRKGFRAVTLDIHGGAESRIAQQLSEACGLDHQIQWLDDRPPVDGETAYRAALRAAVALDGMASPLALGPLLLIEADLEQGYRLSGVAGETARGFYHPGQPRRATTSVALVRRLADRRLVTNEAVDPVALDPDFASEAYPAALNAIGDCFARYDARWLRATDEFYLRERVQRWAGVHESVASVERYAVDPLLDRRFLQLALTPDPAEKRHSRLTGQLMHRLSPELARIPLDSGLVPARLARPRLGSSVTMARDTAQKTARKFWQLLRKARRAQPGATDMGQLVLARWRAEPELVAPIRRTGLVRDAWLDEVLAGRHGTGPATLAFLLNVLVAHEAASARGRASN